MTVDQIRKLAWYGSFPEENALKRELDQFILNPGKTIKYDNDDKAGKQVANLIAHSYQQLHEASAVVQRDQAEHLAKIEARYQNLLLKAVIKDIEKGRGRQAIRFDPQGHILVEIMVDEEVMLDLYFEAVHENKSSKKIANDNDYKKELEKARIWFKDNLAININRATYCSLDTINNNSINNNSMQGEYKKWAMDTSGRMNSGPQNQKKITLTNAVNAYGIIFSS